MNGIEDGSLLLLERRGLGGKYIVGLLGAPQFESGGQSEDHQYAAGGREVGGFVGDVAEGPRDPQQCGETGFEEIDLRRAEFSQGGEEEKPGKGEVVNKGALEKGRAVFLANVIDDQEDGQSEDKPKNRLDGHDLPR